MDALPSSGASTPLHGSPTAPAREPGLPATCRTAKGGAGWVLVAGLVLATVGFLSETGRASAVAQTTGGQGGSVQPTSSVPSIGSGYGTADSNGAMIAVTGIDVTGGSLLYLIDTSAKQLAVYQAQGGTSSTMNLKFVAGRRIDLDLQVYGFNDESDYTYEELQREFGKRGGNVPSKNPGDASKGDGGSDGR